jgi:hypothetical protein
MDIRYLVRHDDGTFLQNDGTYHPQFVNVRAFSTPEAALNACPPGQKVMALAGDVERIPVSD